MSTLSVGYEREAHNVVSKELLGPDTSHNNGVIINAVQAKNQGMSFCFSKITQGTTFVDSAEVASHHAAVSAGLLPGIYHFGQRGSGEADAKFLLQVIAHEGIDIGSVGIAYDCELQDPSTGPSISDVIAFGETFKSVHPHHPLGLYTGNWYWGGHLGNPALPATYDWLWDSLYVAGSGTPQGLLKEVTQGFWDHYGGKHGAAVPRMRQYSSSAKVANIGRSDISVFWGDMEEMKQIMLPSGAPSPTPKPKPHPKPPVVNGQVEALQREVHVQPNSHWNAVTDAALIEVRGNHHTRAEQHAVGTPVDGVWGPISQHHYIETVESIQGTLGVKKDGVWGSKTDEFFKKARNRYYGK